VGQHGEVVVEQHDLGHGPGGTAARSHCDAEVGILERQGVVDAVAGHGDDMASRTQRPDEFSLLLRRDASEDGMAFQSLAKAVAFGR
jgi:hypothetical protein